VAALSDRDWESILRANHLWQAEKLKQENKGG
jgi:hypothetical protein